MIGVLGAREVPQGQSDKHRHPQRAVGFDDVPHLSQLAHVELIVFLGPLHTHRTVPLRTGL
jgi:hypothetical protein